MSEKKLKCSADKKWMGVCGGLAEYFGVDVTILRILCAILIICTGLVPGLITYLIIALVMSKNNSTNSAE